MNYVYKIMKQNLQNLSEADICKKLTKCYKNQSVYDFWSDYEDSESDIEIGKICPSNSDTDVKDLLYDFMTTHTYDNGLPLTGLNYPPDNPTEEHDFFEHYDRSEDFESAGMDETILSFQYDYDNDFYYIVINQTTENLLNYWTNLYDQSPYDHDF